MVNNVYDLVTRTMEQEFPGRVAFRWVEDATGTVKEKTYAEYAQDIRRAAAWFARNIPEVEGKRMVLLSRNCYEYGVNTFGAVLAGAVLVTMNQKKTWDELSWELELADDWTDAAFRTSLRQEYNCRDQLEAAYGERLRPMDVWKDTAPGGLEKKIDPNALMGMLFTSGTTGRSKAVMLAERNFFTVMQMHVAMGDHLLDFKHRQLPEDKNDVLSNFAILPLFHLGTFICLFSWPFKGWALNLCSDLRNFYRDLGLMHSDSIAVAPVLMESIYKDVKRGRADKLNGLWNPCGSSAMFDSEMLLGLVENGMYITQCYGMTETCGPVCVSLPEDNRIGTIGMPMCGITAGIAEDGELVVKGPLVCKGYHNNPGVTAQQITDGWLHTGDLGDISEDGFISITGRKKDLIITAGGKNVSPGLLEASVMTSPVVNQCLVIGDKKPFVAALVTLDLADANNWLESQGAKPEPDLASLAKNAIVHAEVERAVNAANEGVSRAESIRKFEILPDEFTEANGMLTPSLKTRRAQIVEHYRELIDDVIYVPLKK